MAAEQFKLVRPCKNCPFREDVPGYLRRGRAVEIARGIAEGSIFHCHETTVEDEEGEDLVPGEGSQFCAGALIVMEKADAPNQAMRMAERFGIYDASRLDMTAPVHGSFAAFVDHHGGSFESLVEECRREENGEALDDTCHVAEAGCEAPAGYLVGGHAIPADEGGEVHECPSCGEAVCDSCSNGEGVCVYCADG